VEGILNVYRARIEDWNVVGQMEEWNVVGQMEEWNVVGQQAVTVMTVTVSMVLVGTLTCLQRHIDILCKYMYVLYLYTCIALLPEQVTNIEESSLERTKRGTWLTS